MRAFALRCQQSPSFRDEVRSSGRTEDGEALTILFGMNEAVNIARANTEALERIFVHEEIIVETQ